MVNMEIFEVFETAEKITVYNQGDTVQYTAGSKPYSEILQCWYSMTEVAPAVKVHPAGEPHHPVLQAMDQEHGGLRAVFIQ